MDWKKDPHMQALREQTIQPGNVRFIGGYYRYVNHEARLLTTGFKRLEKLYEYSSCIRFDTGTLIIMSERYEIEYGKSVKWERKSSGNCTNSLPSERQILP